MSHRRWQLGTACAIALLPYFTLNAGALADSPLERGQMPSNVASIAAMLDRVAQLYPGQVLKMELEADDDAPSTWAFEVKVLTTAGRVLEVKLDSVSLAVLEVD